MYTEHVLLSIVYSVFFLKYGRVFLNYPVYLLKLYSVYNLCIKGILFSVNYFPY